MNISLENVITKIEGQSQEMFRLLRNGKIEEAEAIAEKISNNIYHFRKLEEVLKVNMYCECRVPDKGIVFDSNTTANICMTCGKEIEE